MQRLESDHFFASREQSVTVEPRLPQQAYPEHTHNFDEIVIVNSGRGTHVLNGRPHSLYPGMICYIQAQDHHLYENVNDLHLTNVLYRSAHSFYYLNPIDSLLPDRNNDPCTHWCLVKEGCEQIQSILTTLADDGLSTAYRESLFLQLLVLLHQGRYSDKGEGNNADKVNQLLRWLQLNFIEDIDWQLLACQFDLPLRSLHRHIKQRTGYTPQRYLTKLRLSEAHYQLCYSEKNITEIAYDCGFNDSAYFSTSFRHEFDVTPRGLRDCLNQQTG